METSTPSTILLTNYIWFGACLTLLLILAASSWRRRKVSSTLKGIPGPRQFPLGKYLNLLEFADRKKTMKVLSKWCEGSGPIVRLAFGPFDFVTLLSPEYIQKLLSSTKACHLVKPSMGYKDMKPAAWFDGIFTASGDKWKSRRKLISPFMSQHSVLGYTPIINASARVLIRQLEDRFAENNCEPRPIYELLFDTSIAILLKAVFGVDLYEDGGSGGEGSYYSPKKLARMMKRELEIAGALITRPWLRYEPIFRLHPMSRERAAYIQYSSEFILQLIKELQQRHDDGDGSKKSLLKDLVAAGLPNEGIYEETITMMVGGLETTGGVLHSLLFLLALHPRIQEECRKEVDSIFENEEEFCSEGLNISASGLKQLRYVEQCVMECLRMTPPGPIFLRELTGALTLDDHLELPAGTTVAVWLRGIHMNAEYFPEPEKFDPGRWTPEAKNNGRHPFSYLPFSGGPRICIGLKLAMAELLILTAHVLHNFTIATTDKFEDVVWLLNGSMQPETPMSFILQRRNAAPPTTRSVNHGNDGINSE